MFKTFKGKNNKKEERTARINEPHRADGRARITEIEEEEQEFGDNPFDMAPEMTKQFSRVRDKDNNEFGLEDNSGECTGLHSYMDQIDAFIGSGYHHQ